MLVTTLNKIKSHNPCKCGWGALLKHLGKTKSDDDSLSFLTILESNGLDDALWCMKSAPEYKKECRLFAVLCARQVQHLMTDERSISALDVAEKFANGYATREELSAASEASWAAARATASEASWAASWAAARAAASEASWATASEASWAAARAAARSAACSAACSAAWDAAWDAACAATWDAACDAARDAQKEQFIKIIAGD